LTEGWLFAEGAKGITASGALGGRLLLANFTVIASPHQLNPDRLGDTKAQFRRNIDLWITIPLRPALSALGGKADIGNALHKLSLFLPRENRVPGFLVGPGDRFLAFASAVVGMWGGGCLNVLSFG